MIKVSYNIFYFLEKRRQEDTICSKATKTTKHQGKNLKGKKKPQNNQIKEKSAGKVINISLPTLRATGEQNNHRRKNGVQEQRKGVIGSSILYLWKQRRGPERSFQSNSAGQFIGRHCSIRDAV